MSAIATAVVALVLTVVPPPAGAVRLAPFQCDGLSDADLRPLLRVELRERLLDDAAPAGVDFTLVSVACADDAAHILAVRQSDGAPARRRVPLEGVVLEAQPRNVAVAIAELLRGQATSPATTGTVLEPPVPSDPEPAREDAEDPDADGDRPAALALVEPLILMPFTTTRRAGVRTRLGNADVPVGMETPNYYLLGIEPFFDFVLGRRAVLALTLPVTWTEGPATSSWGRIGNLTTALRYTSGGQLRLGIGAALSLGVGQPHAAQAESNVFELDRYRAATHSLRFHADALARAERLYLQAEAAVLVLADQRDVGTLLRAGIAGGIAFASATIGVEYVVLSDVVERYLITGDRFVQALILGTRWTASPNATLGAHLHLALDQGPNLAAALAISAAWAF